MKTILKTLACLFALTVFVGANAGAAEKLKALIIDGQNNHDWKACTPVLKWILEDCGRFVVDVSTTPPEVPAPKAPKGQLTAEQKEAHAAALNKWKSEKAERWEQWRPNFAPYNVVVMNYTGDSWPEPVKTAFTEYVRNGGGLVIVHAADNAFPEWPEFNEMIAVGGWGGRNEKSGPLVYWEDGKIVRDNSRGPGGTHGAQHEFLVETRDPEHPIVKGVPLKWRHASDELYSKMRGPAKNLTILATAKAEPGKGGTDKHEPVLMTVSYGRGRVFHTVLGHGPQAMSGIGFQVTTQRGTEWAATGEVTLPLPQAEQMPPEKAVLRPMPKR